MTMMVCCSMWVVEDTLKVWYDYLWNQLGLKSYKKRPTKADNGMLYGAKLKVEYEKDFFMNFKSLLNSQLRKHAYNSRYR